MDKLYHQIALEKGIPDIVVALLESKYSVRKLQNTFSEPAVLEKKKFLNMDKLYITR